MTGPLVSRSLSSRRWRVLRWALCAAAAPASWACTSRTLESPAPSVTATLTTTVTQKINDNIDILFMIDNSSSMTSMQQKLLAQLPTFMQVLQNLPNGLPNVHIGVVSSDMGAPTDEAGSLDCTTSGDNGDFHAAPEGTCTATTIANGDNYISAVDGEANFTDPIDKVFQCVGLLGSSGCSFEHQLASIDRALGADGSGPPPKDANFVRPDAYLGIVLLTNEDDCSAPSNTTLYSFNGGAQSITNPDGPIANYRCNGGPRGAHLCKDPATGQTLVPPLTPPADAVGNPPILNLTDCQDNESGSSGLTPVSKFVSDIKALKPADPDNDIFVAAITAPPAPYSVEWIPPARPPAGAASELWPQVMHSCGAKNGDDVNPDPQTQSATDGSFGDPGVRIAQFVRAFPNSVMASICDPSYAASMTAIATKLVGLIKPNCITGTIQKDPNGRPECTVTNHLTDSSNHKTDIAVPNCEANGGAPPCWTLNTDALACPGGGVALKLMQDQVSMNAASLTSTLDCSVCLPGSTAPGC